MDWAAILTNALIGTGGATLAFIVADLIRARF